MKKLVIIVLIVAAIVASKILGLDQYLSFGYIKDHQTYFLNYYEINKVFTIAVYSLIYIAVTALSIPGATVLTLLGGAIFGLTTGTIIVSFTSTIGATLAFLISRTLLRESLEKKYAERIKAINQGVEKEGAFYLFTLRLVPVFPFFLINLCMGLTRIKTITFFFVSQVGMLAGTIVYVNAGVQLAELESLKGIMSPSLLGSFALLGIFPLVAKKFLGFLQARKVYKGYKKPKKFDYNMVAIGAGAGGLVTSLIGAAVKAKVALIEKDKMGGDCLNTGCVPSKAIIKSAKVAHTIKNAFHYGVQTDEPTIDFKTVMSRVHNVIKKIEPHDSIERYTELGVDCITGVAKILSPWEVQVGDRVITTKNITISTGASPFVPPIKGLEGVPYLTSHNLWNLEELPKRFAILGAGPIGLEMAQSFSRLGSKVAVFEMGSQVMAKEDADVAKLVQDKMSSEGVEFYLNSKVVEFEHLGNSSKLYFENDGQRKEFEFDKVLICVGRKPNTKGFGLEELNFDFNPNGTIVTNEFLQTKYPNIYACGDVSGPFQLTHAAGHQAWYCAVNGLFSPLKKFKADYRVFPWVTYTDPEVASVGKNEKDCQAEGIEYDLTVYGIDDLDRAIADSADYGMVKVLTKKGSDQIIGATIVGQNAGELNIEFVTSMKHKKGLNAILGTVHSYPTMAEANKYAAGVWKNKTKPEKLLPYLAKFHSWRRG